MDIDNLIGRRVQNMPERLHCKLHPKSPLVIGAGKGPHVAHTRCAECERFTGWVSRAVAGSLSSNLEALD
jgi:hypothetical protein